MGETVLPTDFIEEFRDLRRRVRDLERAPTLRNVSMTGGTTTIKDEGGQERVRLGQIDDEFGIEVKDATGNVALKVTGEGVDAPSVPLATFNPFDGWSYDDPSWTYTRYATVMDTATHAGVACWTWGYTEPGVTGQMRLGLPALGVYTDPITFTGDDVGQGGMFRWLHGLTIGTGPWRVQIQARRTAGSGSFYVYEPSNWALVSGATCTANGIV